jgi:hypothetical protein
VCPAAAPGFPDGRVVSAADASGGGCAVACPADITVPNDPDQCGAGVNYTPPAPGPGCDPADCSPAPGSFFPVGTTTVTCTTTNGRSCEFAVTVNDTQQPTMTCPEDIIVAATPGEFCTTVVDYPLPTASDNCTVTLIECFPPPGTAFTEHETVVQCFAVDGPNISGCFFNIIVEDRQPPAVTCPPDITVPNAPGQSGATVTYAAPDASDECGQVTKVCSPASASFFPLGMTAVTCTVTDEEGNAAMCAFDVTVSNEGQPGTNTAGAYGPSTAAWFLRNQNSPGVADLAFSYGPAAGWVPLSGDWDGDGDDTPGLFAPASSTFFLKNSPGPGAADLAFRFGPANSGWAPIAGDWDGDGVDTVGLFAPASSVFFLRNFHGAGPADVVYGFGPAGAGWAPIAGDWDDDGEDTVGLYSPFSRTFFLRNAHGPGAADLTFSYGPFGATPLAGDWDGDGVDTIGVYIPATATWFLRNLNGPGAADLAFRYGPPGLTPVPGDWDGL